jgi:FkbM family methyltransferase
MGRTLGQRLRKKLLKKAAFPLMNRLLSDSGQHLYHYSPDMDRLFAIDAFGSETYKYFTTGSLDSDSWWRVLQRLELDRGIILDVGANTGYTATWFSTIAERVFAFEPHPNNVRLLREQLRIRRISNVRVIESAVSDRLGSATLRCKPRSGHHSLDDVGASETLGTIEVPCTTIDAFMDAEGIDLVTLLKIDVEGFEPEVLNGARLSLSLRPARDRREASGHPARAARLHALLRERRAVCRGRFAGPYAMRPDRVRARRAGLGEADGSGRRTANRRNGRSLGALLH